MQKETKNVISYTGNVVWCLEYVGYVTHMRIECSPLGGQAILILLSYNFLIKTLYAFPIMLKYSVKNPKFLIAKKTFLCYYVLKTNLPPLIWWGGRLFQCFFLSTFNSFSFPTIIISAATDVLLILSQTYSHTFDKFT